MITNILALPLVSLTVITGNNEDWLDSIQYLANDGVTPIDLSGIIFELEMRVSSTSSEVVLSASNDEEEEEDERLIVGGTGNSFLMINAPVELMKEIKTGDYVADIVAKAEGYTRRVVTMTLSIVEGVTK